MAEAKRDGNYITTLLAVSNADGVTPVVLYADPTTHRLLVSAVAGALDDLSDVVITSGAQGDILYYNGTNWVNLAAGTSGKFLKTQGAAANPIWDTPTAGAAGSDTQVQFNDGGSTLAGDAGLVYNKTTDALSVNGGIYPVTDDTGALGSATKQWADLFLASGALIKFASTDTVLTHSTGILTVSTGDLRVTTAGTNAASVVTVGGTQTLTNKTLTSPTIGTSPTAAGATWTDLGTVTTADINGGTLDGVTIGGASAGAITGTTITVNTNLVPDANDGAGLGLAATAFSDLFLASGAVIGFANGDVTITHSAGVLTLGSSMDIRLTTAGTNAASVVLVGGTQTLTNKTLTSPTLTTPSAFTTGGTITLAENTSIALDPAGSADGKYTGITIAGTAGAALAFGDLVYLAAADSRWELADADAATTADRMLGMVVLAAAADGDPTTLLLIGQIRADAKFPALTIGSAVYVGETAGAIQVAIPTGADNVIRRVGYALTADEIYFNPSMDAQTTVA